MPRHTTISTTIIQAAVFAGIDYHKRSSVITLGDEVGNVLQQVRLNNDEPVIRQFFSKHNNLTCAIESCRGYEWLVDLLRELGVVVHVSNPYATRLIADSRCKTDKVDSRILMELLAKDFLPKCYQATKAERQLREHVRWRAQLVKTRTSFTNQAHALLDKENHGRSLSTKKSRSLTEQVLSTERQELLDDSLNIIEYFEDLVAKEDRWIVEQCQKIPAASVLKTIPGIGNVAAIMLLAELGDVSRFPNAASAAAYVGLTPRLYASSTTRRVGRITKRGPALLRWVLVQCAWVAVQRCDVIRVRYGRIMHRRGKKVAIVAIARLLTEVAYHVLKAKQPFDKRRLALG